MAPTIDRRFSLETALESSWMPSGSRQRRARARFGVLLLSLTLVTACSDDAATGADAASHGGADGAGSYDQGSSRDGGRGDGSSSGDGSSAGQIRIYVKGDLTKVAFNDGLSGQTPTDYKIAITRYEAMRSATDASPQLCFDHGSKPKVADMHKDNLVGSCATSKVASATYAYGRTTVAWARFTVNGSVHYLGQTYPGKLTFFRAYSDTTYQGKSYKAATGTFTFKGITTISIPVTYPHPKDTGGIRFRLKNGTFTMTFPYTHPLRVVKDDPGVHWARFHWKIADAFRWQDIRLSGYKAGVWDVAPPPGTNEVVKLYGVSGYRVTASTD